MEHCFFWQRGKILSSHLETLSLQCSWDSGQAELELSVRWSLEADWEPSGSCWGFPGVSDSKESACNAGDPGSISGSRRSLGEGRGYLLQYSWLENSMVPHHRICLRSSTSFVSVTSSVLGTGSVLRKGSMIMNCTELPQL